jgi:ABC-type multidrug transport system fused ATPase/permease subunit
MKFIGILSIITAILISAVSVYFSVTGIRIIFSGAVIAVTFMVGVLELGKISAAVWLYHFWKKSTKLFRGYFILAITILILISSLGIFSFLSSAFIEKSKDTQNIETKIERVNRYIEREEDAIKRANEQLDQLDKAIDKYIELDVVTKGLNQRQEQEEERKQLNNRITEAENKIAEYEDRLFELKERLNTLEVNVGPVKYIAMLLYGEKNAEDFYDNAARILIILIVIVFDPFAVLLMVAGNIALDRKPKKKVGRPKGSTSNKKPQGKQTKEQQDSQKPEKAKEQTKDSVDTGLKDSNPPKLHRKEAPKIKKRRKIANKP